MISRGCHANGFGKVWAERPESKKKMRPTLRAPLFAAPPRPPGPSVFRVVVVVAVVGLRYFFLLRLE